MATGRLDNYLRTYRKHSGLSQSDVSFLVRASNKSELSRYERGLRRPSLRTALACEAVYGVPISEIFAGLSDAVTRDTQLRARALQARIEREMSRGRGRFTPKLQWVSRLLTMPNFKLVQNV